MTHSSALATLAAFATFILACSAVAPGALAQSCDSSSNQQQLNACAGDTYQAADKELNQVYQQILKDYADDPVFLEKLKEAQRAWITFRDAELAARYPASDTQAEYGSIYPYCAAGVMTELTKARIETLKVWVDGIAQGDGCTGSYKVK